MTLVNTILVEWEVTEHRQVVFLVQLLVELCVVKIVLAQHWHATWLLPTISRRRFFLRSEFLRALSAKYLATMYLAPTSVTELAGSHSTALIWAKLAGSHSAALILAKLDRRVKVADLGSLNLGDVGSSDFPKDENEDAEDSDADTNCH